MRQEKPALRFCWQQSVVLSPLKYHNKKHCRVLRKAAAVKMTRRSVNTLSQLLSIRDIFFFKANTALPSSTPVKMLFKSHRFSGQRVQRQLLNCNDYFNHTLSVSHSCLKLMLSDLFCRPYESMSLQHFAE